MPDDAFHVYDTTLRDGAQQEGLTLTVADKLAIARQPGRARRRLHRGRLAGRHPQGHRVLPARRAPSSSSSTRSWRRSARPAGRARRRPTTRRSPRCASRGAPVVTLVAKSHDRHVELALRTTLAENLAMIARHRQPPARARASGSSSTPSTSSTATASDPAYALEVVRTAAEAGADVVALCDTNGGMLPAELADVVADGRRRDRRAAGHPLPRRHRAARWPTPSRRATPASRHVQGTANGYGERAGNANLFSVVAGLQLKQGRAGAARRAASPR